MFDWDCNFLLLHDIGTTGFLLLTVVAAAAIASTAVVPEEVSLLDPLFLLIRLGYLGFTVFVLLLWIVGAVLCLLRSL